MQSNNFFNNFLTQLKQNRQSGVSVGIVSVCLSIPLAIASGATPLQGLLAAVWAGLFASIFSASNYNILGPAGALTGLMIVFVASIGAVYIPILTVISGLFILAFYLLRISKYITLIPSTALHGFVLGTALLLAGTQLNNALGLTWLTKHSDSYQNIMETLLHLGQTHFPSFILFIIGLAFLLTRKRFIKNIPGVLPLTAIGIILGMLAASGGRTEGVHLLRDNFPNLSFSLRQRNDYQTLLPNRHTIPWGAIVESAFVVAIVSVLETIISAKVADKRTKTRHNQRREVFGLSLANIVSGIMGGMPATGVFLRTAMNMRSGATSRLSQGINAITVMVISALLFTYFTYLPVPLVGAVLINLAIGLIDVAKYKTIRRYDRAAFWILITVGLITFFKDPMRGVIFGTAVALLIHIHHSADGDLRVTIFRGGKYHKKMMLSKYIKDQHDKDVLVVKFAGEINFMNVAAELDMLSRLHGQEAVILSMSQIAYMDIDGLESFEEMVEALEKQNLPFYITGVEGDLEERMKKLPLYSHVKAKEKLKETSYLALNDILS